jgi:hypothetical protein
MSLLYRLRFFNKEDDVKLSLMQIVLHSVCVISKILQYMLLKKELTV